MAAAEELQCLLQDKDAELQALRRAFRRHQNLDMQSPRQDSHRHAVHANDQLTSDVDSLSGCIPASYQHQRQHSLASKDLPAHPMHDSLMSENEHLQRELDRMYVQLAVRFPW